MKKYLLSFCLLLIITVQVAATNYAGVFNGSTSAVNLGTTIGSAGIRSIEFWFKPAVNFTSSTSASGWTFINRNDNTQLHEYELYLRGTDWNSVGGLGYLYFAVRYNGTLHEIRSNSNSWNAGTWYHVAGVIDPATGMKLYIDGVQQTMTDAGATQAVEVDNSNASNIGAWGSVRHLQGEMEEMRFWSRAITVTEINTKKCQDLVVANETGLLAYYKFDEGTGPTLVDETSLYNGSISNMTWVADSPCLAPGNYVMHFDGSGDYIDIGTAAGNTGIRSIEAWFNPDVMMSPSTSANGYTIVNRNDGAQQHEYEIYLRGTDWNSVGGLGYLYFAVRYNGTLHEIRSNSSSWAAGTWYHVAGVIDPTTGMKLYIDGVLQTMTDASATSPVDVDNVNATAIGQWGGTRCMHGSIDELRFWDRAISQTEISNKMCLNLDAASETGLVGYWKFNEGSGAYNYDSCLVPHDGTVFNATWLQDDYCAEIGMPEHQTEGSMFDVYPNPSTGEFFVNTNAHGTLRIYDEMGKLVKEMEINSPSRVDLSAEAAGVYMLMLLNESEEIIGQQKIIRN